MYDFQFFSGITYVREGKAFSVFHRNCFRQKNSSNESLSFTDLLGGKDESLNPGHSGSGSEVNQTNLSGRDHTVN